MLSRLSPNSWAQYNLDFSYLSLPSSPSWYNRKFYLSYPHWKRFFFFRYWGLNLGPTPWATPPALFLWWIFWDRVSWIICLGWLWTTILLISASWVVRIIGVSHCHQATDLTIHGSKYLYEKSRVCLRICSTPDKHKTENSYIGTGPASLSLGVSVIPSSRSRKPPVVWSQTGPRSK
jgi:hypothetical protein